MCVAHSQSSTPKDKFAGCDEYQCGRRFLDSSAPRLIRHVASCEAAGGGIKPLPAGKDEKLSQEFEDRVLIGSAAPAPSLLDSITNNRHNAQPDHYARPVGRGKHCGRWSIRGKDPKTNRAIVRRVNCGSWSCCYCGPRKAKLARRRIREVAEQLDLRYFLTLTLDPKKLKNQRVAVPYMRLVFNKFREYLRRQYGESPKYVCVLEFTQKGVPHLHVLIDRYIPQKWISKTWARLGGGRIVFIKQVTVRNVARYLSKYLTKELLLSAVPKGTRRITAARAIKFFPKLNSGIAWEFLRESIWQLLTAHSAATFSFQSDLFRFTILHFDEERFLKGFEMVEDG
jgi:hypothetical protein